MSAQPPRTLNLGSGKDRRADAVNLDITEATSPDVVHDLERFPWPFADSAFDHVVARDVLEHLSDPLRALDEVHRILDPGGTIEIVVPHYSSVNAFTDLTHRGFFSSESMDYVTGEHHHDFYTMSQYRTKRREIVFRQTLANRVVRRLANRYPDRYEARWAWIFPAWFLVFELVSLKSDGAKRD